MKIEVKQPNIDTDTKIIYIETSYKYKFKINKTKSGYILLINKSNERETLC